jgi:glycosyltransferase involved in cell wall biosynthesis
VGRRRVAVLELDPLGHRLRYVRLLLVAAGASGPAPLLLVPPAVRSSPEFAEHLADVTAEVLEVPTGRFAAVRAAVAAAAQAGAHLVVPDGDKNVAPLLAALARVGVPPAVSLLLMRTVLPGGSERTTPGMAVKPPLAWVLARLPGMRVRFLTDAFGVVVRRRGFPGIEPVRDPVLVPDAGSPPARDPDAPFRLGVFGVISARKNVPLLLAALEQVPDVHLVVGGRCDDDVTAALAASPLGAQGRLHVDDRLLPEAEFDAAVAGVDAVAVLHDNDAPSGIVAEAAARGVPVLGPARGWASSMVTGTGIGEVAEVAGPDAAPGVAEAVRRLRSTHARRVAAARRVRTRLGTEDFVRGLLGDVL